MWNSKTYEFDLWNWNLEVLQRRSSVPRQIWVAFRHLSLKKPPSNNGGKISTLIPILVLQKYPTNLFFNTVPSTQVARVNTQDVAMLIWFEASFYKVTFRSREKHRGSFVEVFWWKNGPVTPPKFSAAVDAKRWPFNPIVSRIIWTNFQATRAPGANSVCLLNFGSWFKPPAESSFFSISGFVDGFLELPSWKSEGERGEAELFTIKSTSALLVCFRVFLCLWFF